MSERLPIDRLDRGACRSCGAPMRWAVTRANKKIPLNPEPAPNGNVDVTEDGFAIVLGTAAADEARVERDLYISHFATCPNRQRHRRS